jgi:hypothetical protein
VRQPPTPCLHAGTRRRSLSQSRARPRRNLSTHRGGATLSSLAEAQRLLNRLELHHVPERASRLNMVEIEIGVLRGQCLDRRISKAARSALYPKLLPGSGKRNTARVRIKWMFTTEKA